MKQHIIPTKYNNTLLTNDHDSSSTVNHWQSFSTPNLQGMIYVETVKLVPTSFHLSSLPSLPWLRGFPPPTSPFKEKGFF
ncbi:hypothetical protein CEXT_63501 [Caerostris extrusa]|uniref:Uncharacterized protein n=1 Tax=Caerostris extrusa TaxID=172846 RepID=A0AAV4Y9B2_CAEEX|nr:hypothetical protein CEXT_63501 [Caerostris extrusa]